MNSNSMWKWGGLLALGVLLATVFYTVGEGYLAIITQFGRPVAVVRSAGLHVKWPWQTRILLDARLQPFNPQPSELLTRDKKNLVVDSFMVWRIADPQRFVQAV